MTMKDFMTAVIAANLSEDMTAFATAEVAKIDAKNAKRRTTPTKAQAANAEFLTSIVDGMTVDEVVTAAEVAAKFGVTTQKASAVLSGGVKSGVLVASEVKVKGKGKVKGYSLPDPADSEVQALPDEIAV